MLSDTELKGEVPLPSFVPVLCVVSCCVLLGLQVAIPWLLDAIFPSRYHLRFPSIIICNRTTESPPRSHVMCVTSARSDRHRFRHRLHRQPARSHRLRRELCVEKRERERHRNKRKEKVIASGRERKRKGKRILCVERVCVCAYADDVLMPQTRMRMPDKPTNYGL